MVNLILVSHSYPLACGVAELAEQMNNGCQIAVAAGLEDPPNGIGTDAMRIVSAIEQVFSPDGVVILVDLGSAILSAETALDFIDPEMASQVKICAAPLVEGAIAATVAASNGGNLADVVMEAENALNVKKAQLGQAVSCESNHTMALPDESALHFSWTVLNPQGIHARPAARLIEAVAPFQATVWVKAQQQFANLRSYNQLIQLQIRAQQQITFYAQGEDAKQALSALQQLAEQHFGEQLNEQAHNQSKWQGQAILANESVGQAVWFSAEFAKNSENLPACGLNEAIEKTQQQLMQLAEQPRLSDNFRSLFQAHCLLLDDIVAEIQDRSDEMGEIAACQSVFQQMIEEYAQLDSPYLRARALDVEDLQMRLLANLQGAEIALPSLHPHAILCAKTLYPSQLVALLDSPFVAICVEQGSIYSHTALIAQSLNLPMWIAGESLRQVCQDDWLKLHWQSGEMAICPAA